MSDLRDAVIQLSFAIEKLAPLSAGEHQIEIERHVTGYSEKQMASLASGYALKFVERGGAVPSPDPRRSSE